MENSSGNRPLTSSELDAVSGGVKQADKGTSETVKVAGPCRGP